MLLWNTQFCLVAHWSGHDLAQVSFGVHKTEEEAARQYDRALIIVKGRLAKTNFPVGDYDREIEAYEQLLWQR